MKKSLIGIMTLTSVALADCTSALTACNNYVNALKEETAALSAMNAKLKEQRDEANTKLAQSQSTIPGWGKFLLGAAAGIVAKELLFR